MKRTLSLLVLACAAFVPVLSGAEVDPVKRDAFLKQVTEAYSKANIEAVRALYSPQNVTRGDIDRKLTWEVPTLEKIRKGQSFVQPALFIPLDSPEIDAGTREAVTKGSTVNGRSHVTNLPAVGFVKIFFSGVKDGPPGQNGYGSIQPVGVASDGTLRYVLSAAKPDSLDPEANSAKIAAFVRRVDALYQAKDVEGLKYLHDWGTMSPSAIDDELYSLEFLFAHRTYEGVVYVSTRELSGPTINPDFVKLATRGNEIQRPNLLVMGFLRVTFKDEDGKGTSSNIIPFGLSADGNLRFTSEVATTP